MVKRYGVISLIMASALVVAGLVAGTESAVSSPDRAGASVVTGEWTPEVELHVARLVANGVPTSGECPLSV